MNKTLYLYQPQNGYCYNSDTHFLYNFMCSNLEQFKNIQGELLDIGSGSGVLGLLIARDFEKLRLNQVEIQNDFQFLSQKNSDINNIQNYLYKGSLFDIKFDKQFDYIVSNPPFYSSDVIKSENESLKIARYNDDFSLDLFISKVVQLLKPKGKFFFCYDIKQLTNIFDISDKLHLNIESIQFLHPNNKKNATLVMVYCRLNSKSKLKILPPMVMFDENSTFSKTTNNIYDKCSTYSIKCTIA